MILRLIPTRRFTMWCFFALTVLLIVAWLSTLRGDRKLISRFDPATRRGHSVFVGGGTVGCSNTMTLRAVPPSFPRPLLWSEIGGQFYYWDFQNSATQRPADAYLFYLRVPLPWLISATALAACVARTEFRFSLKFLLLIVTLSSFMIAWYGYWQPHFAQK